MPFWLLVFFLTPILEMYLLIRVGGYIGAWPTIALVMLTAVIGVALLRVQGLATLTRGMAAKRYLIEFPIGIYVPFFNYLDGLWQLWDKPYQQTLHDKFAKTAVVYDWGSRTARMPTPLADYLERRAGSG